MKQIIKNRAKIYAWPKRACILFVLAMASIIVTPVRSQVVPGQNLWQEIAEVAVDFNQIEQEVQSLEQLTSLIDFIQSGTTITASLADLLLDGTCEVSVALEDINDDLSIINCKMGALVSVADEAEQGLESIADLLGSDADILIDIAQELPETRSVLEEILADLSSLESSLENLDDMLQDTESNLEVLESVFDEIEQELLVVERSALGADDLVEDIESTLESVVSSIELISQEANSIQSLADIIQETTENTLSTLESIEDIIIIIDEEVTEITSVLDIIEDNVDEALDLAQDIESTFEAISSDLDIIEETAVGVQNALEDSIVSLESSLDTIETIIDTVENIESVVDVITSQVESLDSAADILVSITDSTESVVSEIASITDQIESVTEVIESKLDVESSVLELLESEVDILLAQSCTYLIYQADVDAGGGTYTISAPGTYCLAESINGTIVTNKHTSCVVLDLNNYVIRPVGFTDGIVVDTSEHIVVKNGWIKGSEDNGNTGILIQGSSDVLVQDLRIVTIINNGIFMDDSRCVTIERCIIDQLGGLAIIFNNTDESAAKNCVIRQSLVGVEMMASFNNLVSNCLFLSCLNGYQDGSLNGQNNFCESCIVGDFNEAFNPGIEGGVRDSIVTSGINGFIIDGFGAIGENCTGVNITQAGILLFDAAAGTKGNYISGAGQPDTTGIVDFTTNGAKVFNNLVQNFDMNYSAVDLATIEWNPDDTTRFWANLSRAEV